MWVIYEGKIRNGSIVVHQIKEFLSQVIWYLIRRSRLIYEKKPDIIRPEHLIMKELVYKFADSDMEHDGMREVRRLVFVKEQGIPETLVFSGDLTDDENVVVVLDNQNIIGTARIIFPSENTAKIERMAVLEKYRNSGTGRKMMSFMIAEIQNRGFGKVYLHAQHSAVDFYRSCGFRVVGIPFQEAGIQHVKMELNLSDMVSSNTSDFLEDS